MWTIACGVALGLGGGYVLILAISEVLSRLLAAIDKK